MADTKIIKMKVNGQEHALDMSENVTLLTVLRDELRYTGPKECCGVGECGACTVLVDGKTVNACLMLATEAEGTEITTVEGLSVGGEMSVLQESFLEHGAAQCGFCIPGFMVSAHALLAETPKPDKETIREYLSGNLCRCGGYKRIVDAVHAASLKGDSEPRTVEKCSHSKSSNSCKASQEKYVGKNVSRRGGRERVTGTQEFLADIPLDDMLHVKLVTIDVACARILSIDTAAAKSLPGVTCVITAEDLPKPMQRFGPVYEDRPILATQETKYHGEAVAAVVAETVEAAEQAVSMVLVDYEVLPAILSVEDAVSKGAPLVQNPDLRADDPLANSNVLKERNYSWGEVEDASAHIIVENNYSFPMVTHFAIEPHGFIAQAGADEITLWSPVQHPFLLRRMMADLFDLPTDKVRVYAPDPGGGFGGKQNPKFEPLLIILSQKTGRPCRLVLTLEETFQAVRRAAAEIKIRTGFTRSGDIVFQDIVSDFLIGAYVDIAERVMTKANYLACGPYRVPNAKIKARAILSNTTPSCAFRGFGTPQISWAVESQMDAAARELGLDGLQIRMRNIASKGDEFLPGEIPADGHWPQSVTTAAEALGWDTPLPSGRGRGIAIAIKSGATTGLSNSRIHFSSDGCIILYAGTSDMGQGARTIFAQLAADAFGIPLEDVSVVMGDTATVPFDLQTSASRSTVFMGTAITRACEDIFKQLCALASEHLEIASQSIRIADGMVVLAERSVSILEFLKTDLAQWKGELIGRGQMRKPHMAEHPLGGTPAFFEFNCTAFEVEVDTDTGEILIVKHVTVGDVGKALNPMQVKMQDEGAAVMGLGHSLMEHLIFDNEGRILNLGALDYRIPTTKDMPLELKAFSIENGDGPGPQGSKGVSEGGLLCTAPALAAAVAQATGAVITKLPLTPERVWRSCGKAAAAEGDH